MSSRFRLLDAQHPSSRPSHLAGRDEIVEGCKDWAVREEWFVAWYTGEFGWPRPGDPTWLLKLKQNCVRVLSWN